MGSAFPLLERDLGHNQPPHTLSPSPSHFAGAAVLSLPAPALPLCTSLATSSRELDPGCEAVTQQRREEVGDTAQLVQRVQGRTYTEQNASLTFAFSLCIWHCVVLVKKVGTGLEKLLLLPTPISTFSVRVSYCQGRPSAKEAAASSAQATAVGMQILSQSIPLPQEIIQFGGSWNFRSAICFHRAATKRLLLVKTTDDRSVQDRNVLSNPKEHKFPF